MIPPASSPECCSICSRQCAEWSYDDPTDQERAAYARAQKVLERYKKLGIGDRAELVHSLNDTKNNQVMQFVPKFVRSVTKPKQ